jgi:hypothetical protein
MSERVSPALRRVVAARAGDRCEYCQSPAQFSTQSFTLDHVRPRSAGGRTQLSNLAWACLGCNQHKYSKRFGIDPWTQSAIALFNPRQERWIEHFAWSADYTLISGLTPCGRATVEALQLNRPSLVNLRRILVEAGLHPSSLE